MAVYVFVYGSLLSPISMRFTINRIPPLGIPCILHGYRKAWSANGIMEKYLNIEPVSTNDTWGALIRLSSNEELELLDKREGLYSRINVTTAVELPANSNIELTSGDVVYTYTVTNKLFLKGKAMIYWDYYCLAHTAAMIYGQSFFNNWKKDVPKLKWDN